MIDQHTLVEVANALRQLDLSAENALIAERESEIARFREAIASADARCAEISQKMGKQRYPELQRQDVADALLAGVMPEEAAERSKREEELREERGQLTHAASELRRRIESAERDIYVAKSAANRRARETAQPLIEDLLTKAREAATVILSAYGSIRAVCQATNTGGMELLKVRRVVDDGIFADEQLLSRSTPVIAADEVLAVLDNLSDKGPALNFRGTS